MYGDIELPVTLERHCIEKACRRTYERLLGMYFRSTVSSSEKKTLEQKIDGLRYLLQFADFGHLRSQYPELSGQIKTEIVIIISRAYRDMIIHTPENSIIPVWKAERHTS